MYGSTISTIGWLHLPGERMPKKPFMLLSWFGTQRISPLDQTTFLGRPVKI
jgi:hypothetical protein